jgi:cell division protein FtsW
MKLFSRADNSYLARWWWTVDRVMLGAILIMIGVGVVLVSTASPPVASHLGLGDFHFLVRHVVILVPSLILLVGVSTMSKRNIWRLSTIIFLISILVMMAVLVTGMEIKGAQRWVHVFGFSLQPSEFAKPAFAVIAAWLMAMQKKGADERGKIFPGNKITAGLYFLLISLLLLQPDLGMTLVVTSIWAAQIFLAGFPFRLLFGFVTLAAVGIVLAYTSFSHVQSRIDRFLDPASGDNYQVDRSLEAFQNGGLFGTGPGQGEVKLLLPDAHADFIFAVAGEELGLLFILMILGGYFFILARGFNRMMDSQDMFVLLAVGGLMTMFGLQAFVHMGSSLHILPAKGMTLPFISYGGSSLLSMSLSMGFVLALTRKESRVSISKGGLSRFSPQRYKPSAEAESAT